MSALFGTALACVALVVSSLFSWREPVAMFRLLGSGVYLVGTVLVTMVGNVPLNNALAAVDPASSEGAAQWEWYVPRWTAWNTVRTVAAIIASALLTLAVVAGRTGQTLDALRTR